MRYYFAYGLNMDAAGMRIRCPAARQVGLASLHGFRFVINHLGLATIVPDRGSRVEGVLWLLTDDDERALDAFEGVRYGLYRKHRLSVRTGRRRVNALVYRAKAKREGRLRRDHLRWILDAARREGIDAAYLRQLERARRRS